MVGENDRVDRQSNRQPGSQRGGAVAPAPDVLLDVLCDQTRRRLLWYLLDESSASTEELTNVLVGWEFADSSMVDAGRRGTIAASLHHVHLPKLTAAGLVDHDASEDTVALASLAEPVPELVRSAYEYDKAAGSETDPEADVG